MTKNKVKAGLGGFDIFSPKKFRIQILELGVIEVFATPSFSMDDKRLILGKEDFSGTTGDFKLNKIIDIFTLEDKKFGNIVHIKIEL